VEVLAGRNGTRSLVRELTESASFTQLGRLVLGHTAFTDALPVRRQSPPMAIPGVQLLHAPSLPHTHAIISPEPVLRRLQ